MPSEERLEVSKRMKKYWAQRRQRQLGLDGDVGPNTRKVKTSSPTD